MSPPKPHRTSHRASRASRASRLRRKTLTTTPYKPPNQIKGIFAGSGLLLNIPCMAEQLVKLSGKAKEDCIVLYLGTASYDIELKTQNQTSWYEKNCKQLIVMNVVANAPKTSYMRECIVDKADIIIVSGGNTSFAIRRWKKMGIDKLLREACFGPRGVTMAGGSAGAICWFDGGHSDSLDPDSFKEAKLAGVGAKDFEDGEDDEDDDDEVEDDEVDDDEDDDDEDDEDDEEDADWGYMRVNGLGFIPGLCCPHHDRIQSNGVLRAYDMDEMILRHPTEVGICIDHNAAFQINGNEYKVLYPKVSEEDVDIIDPAFLVGSVSPDGTFDPDRTGLPGCWIKRVVDGNVVDRMLCPDVGEVSSILVIPEKIRQSIRNLDIAKIENPDTGPMRMSYMATNNSIQNSSTFSPKTKRDMLSRLKAASNAADDQRSNSLSPTTTPGKSLLEQIFDDDNEDEDEKDEEE